MFKFMGPMEYDGRYSRERSKIFVGSKVTLKEGLEARWFSVEERHGMSLVLQNGDKSFYADVATVCWVFNKE